MINIKSILQLDKRQSIVQRIDSLKSSMYGKDIKEKLSRFHYFGYPTEISKLMTDKVSSLNIHRTSKIAVVNDFGLEVISELQKQGYGDVYILCTEQNNKLFQLTKCMVETEFNFNKVLKLDDMRNDDRFDLVIANPPYEIGGDVIAETMKHCDKAVVLMPASRYRKYKLYECVESCESVDAAMFDDASVSDNLCIATLGKRNNRRTYVNAIESNIVDQRFKRFYDQNRCREHSSLNIFTDGYFPVEEADKIKPYWFCLTARTAQDGVHTTTSCADYRWNIVRDTDWTNYHVYTYNGKQLLTIGFLQFETEQEHKNFCDFWYRNGLSNMLMKGLRKSSGKMNDAIPKVDWSRSWTDEEILKDYGYTDEEIKEILK